MREHQTEYKKKCSSMQRAWAEKDKHIRNSLDMRAQQIDYTREIQALKKYTQEEKLDQQVEWGKRFSEGVAKQLTEKVERINKIHTEKKRIRLACESYRN